MKTKLTTLLALTAPLCGFTLSSAAQMGEDTQLHVLADAAFVYQDNLFLRSQNEIADRYLEFSPGLELRLFPQGAASATIRYQHRFTFFRDKDELDGDYSDLDISAKYNTGVIVGQAYARFREDASNTTDVNLDGVLIERDHLDAGGSMKYDISELTAMKIGVDYSAVDYELGFFTDHEAVAVPLTFFYKIRPKIDLTAGVRYRTTNTSGGFQQAFDYEDTYYFVGAVGELFSPVIYADVSVGFQEREYDNSALDATSGSYDITFIYVGDVKTNVYLGLSRDYRTSAIAGRTYAFTSASLGATYKLNDMVSLNGSVVYGETEYEQSLRAEDMQFLNLGASYTPNEYLTFNASYRYADVDGNGLDNASSYENNTIRVSASLRY